MPNGQASFSYASEGIRDIYEITPEQVANNVAAIDHLLHPDDLVRYYDSLRASAAGLTPWHLEYRVILPRQGLRWRQADARPRRLEDGSILWHGFITDVTERKRIEFELEGFATIDFLTQLPNRRYFIQRMEEELARIQRVAGARTAVLMCDLDHFKNINDCYGHAVGDLVLKHFAGILRDELRKIDTAGRVGGEEFAIVLGHAGIDEAMIFARRLQKKVARLPLVNGDATIPVTLSIGIAVMKVTDSCTDAALSRGDIALYRAKESGRNRIEADVS
jgi:diguanylate cyclase (GGDEF)-like protein